ncbi:MAG TPA: ATP-binding protein [Roseiflexaceae bacterium]|jgi:signal transduction histidine kinase/ActR/RegA family two-component response regulator|nr:ATP-binding protein [Roseiflexaceae bacterium]
MKPSSPKPTAWTEQWPFVALVVVAALSIALLQWNHQRWQQTLKAQTAALDNLLQVRINTNRSYLITEQVASGDQTSLPQDALAYADRALLTIDDWLDGRDVFARAISDFSTDPDLRALLLQYRDGLVNFRGLEARALQDPARSTAADAVDRRIAFSNLERSADTIEHMLHMQLEATTEAQQQQHVVTIVLWSAFLLVLGTTVLQSLLTRRAAIAALQASEERLRAQYKGIPVPTYTWQRVGNDFVLQTYNDAAETVTQGRIAHIAGKRASEVFTIEQGILADFERCFAERATFQRELSYQLQTDEQARDMLISYVFVSPDLIMIHTEDRTERNQLEAQLMRAQRMESVGRLAGGIAHDFNNLLTAINGFAALAAESMPADEPVQEDLAQIQHAVGRAARLTSQLLAFARRQQLQPSNLSINELLYAMETLIRRVLPENVSVRIALGSEVGIVHADPGQLEQVVLNLVLNARDAMHEGGQLIIETANVELDDAWARQRIELLPGRYVMISISDTGIGMTPEVQAQAFDPFFTTKGPQQGSGLGLAMCYGIVKQHNGHIALYSEPGQGTTVRIYLPQSEAEAVQQLQKPDDAQHHGTETILVAEDEAQVRTVIVRMLRQQGYTVLEAANGLDALNMAMLHSPGTIQLLITDVIMPDMHGRDLAEHLGKWDSSIKLLFVSGYAESLGTTHQHVDEGVAVLSKPFSADTLARTIRSILDSDAIQTTA